jgi:hypothetical protein
MRRRLLLLLLLVVACKSPREATPERTPAPLPTPAPATRAETTVRVDRRVELVSVDAAFGPLADHPAIATTRELRASRGISYDAPIHLAMHLDDDLAPQRVDELVALERRWQGIDVAAYAAQLADLARAGKLDDLLAAQRDYTTRVEQALRPIVAGEGASGWFDELFGPRADTSFVVVPGLLTGSKSFGTRSKSGDRTELVQVLGIAAADGLPVADEQTVRLLVHETAHSYINPAFELHHGKLAASGQKIFALVERRMRAQAYTSWQTMLNEAGVRAVTTLYLRDRRGDEAGARAAREEQRLGFLWTNELADVFRGCRREHPGALEACMPRVVGFFDQLAEQYRDGVPKLPFLGPIDAVFDDPVFVVSDGALAGYVRGLRDQLFARSPVVAPGKTTYADHPGRHLVAYGAPQANPIVENVLAHAKITVDPDAIVVGSKRFTGPGLVLVFARFRWDEPSRGVVIYTAARDADLAGFNHAVRHGPTDWLVARRTAKGFELVEAGDFPRAVDGAWLLP